MIFLRPITPQVKGNPAIIYDKRYDESEIPDRISLGNPVAQMYGLGAPWTNDNHKKFNRTMVCGKDSNCLKVSTRYAELHYAVGPPYVLVKEDFYRQSNTWTRFLPIVRIKYPHMLGEMYAYSLAAAHEELNHFQLNNYMISEVDSVGEGTKWIDLLDNVCQPPDNGIFYPNTILPNVIHYCQHYTRKSFSFGKRGFPMDFFTCGHSPLEELPKDFGIPESFQDIMVKVSVGL